MAIHIAEDVCKGCGLCVYYCPEDVLAMSTRRNAKGANVAEVCQPEACIECRLCEINCPDLAIWVLKAAASDR